MTKAWGAATTAFVKACGSVKFFSSSENIPCQDFLCHKEVFGRRWVLEPSNTQGAITMGTSTPAFDEQIFIVNLTEHTSLIPKTVSKNVKQLSFSHAAGV